MTDEANAKIREALEKGRLPLRISPGVRDRLSGMDYEALWGEIAYAIEHGGDPVAVLRAHFPEPAPAEQGEEQIVEVSPGVWLTPLRHAAECLWRDLPLKGEAPNKTFRSSSESIDCIEEHMKALLAARPQPARV